MPRQPERRQRVRPPEAFQHVRELELTLARALEHVRSALVDMAEGEASIDMGTDRVDQVVDELGRELADWRVRDPEPLRSNELVSERSHWTRAWARMAKARR